MLRAGEVTIALSPALRKQHLMVPVASDLDGVFPQEFVLVQSPDMLAVTAQARAGDLALQQVTTSFTRIQHGVQS